MKWPTLKGRLANALTSELEALEQMEKTNQLSEYAQKRLKKLRLRNSIDRVARS